MSAETLARLNAVMEDIGPLAVAVSGGVDSMALAVVAHRMLGDNAQIYHAISVAVPPDATERVRRYAERHRWTLRILDAGEFDDPAYVANPVDRCFFCKTHLYAAIAREVDATLVSGTNTDDLSDYRPGLRAAENHGVRHPYVEAGIDKAGVRGLARQLGLDDLAELPAGPCLSSRIETGIAIDADTLRAVYRSERRIAQVLSARTVRCRVRRDALVVEVDAESLAALDSERWALLSGQVAADFAQAGVELPVRFEPYRMGSAFLRGGAAV
jgi:uncharacterized protein